MKVTLFDATLKDWIVTSTAVGNSFPNQFSIGMKNQSMKF